MANEGSRCLCVAYALAEALADNEIVRAPWHIGGRGAEDKGVATLLGRYSSAMPCGTWMEAVCGSQVATGSGCLYLDEMSDFICLPASSAQLLCCQDFMSFTS